MTAKLYGVVIADVIGSGERQELRPLLHKLLRGATREHQRRKLALLPYAVTAGDEFQTITANLTGIPWMLLDLRSRMQPLFLRIGVGIGAVKGRIVAPVNELDGAAFRLARAAMDNLKNARRSAALTFFRTSDENFDGMANLIYALHDTLVQKMTEKQWKTVAARIAHDGVQETAQALGLDSSTVSRNLKRGYYGQLVAAARGVEQLIAQQF